MRAVPPRERCLRAQHGDPVPDDVERRAHERPAETPSPGGGREHDPTDARHLPVRSLVEHAQVAEQLVVLDQQHVPRGGLDVAAVEVGVGAVLLHHEDLLPEPPGRVGQARGEVVEGEGEDVHGATVSRSCGRAA